MKGVLSVVMFGALMGWYSWEKWHETTTTVSVALSVLVGFVVGRVSDRHLHG